MSCQGAVYAVGILGHKPIITSSYTGLSAFLCIAVLTAGHCCLSSNVIVVTLSAYDLEAWPPEQGVLTYTAVDRLLPEEYLDDSNNGNWDVCIVILPEAVSIQPAPIGEPPTGSMSHCICMLWLI